MKTKMKTLLGAGLALLVTLGTTHRAAAQTPPDLPLLFSGPVEVQTRVKPPRYTTVQRILAREPDGGIRELTTGTMGATRPSWSRDYRYIAFVRGGKLTVMEAIGEPNGARVFEVCPAYAAGHDWAPDGSSIVFCGSPDLGNGLWEVPVNPETEEVGTPVLIREGSCGDPSWSPDGTTIAFNGDYGKVRVLDLLNGTEISFGRTSATPTWNPTGDKLAFAGVVCDIVGKGKKATTQCFYEICIANPDGTEWTRVTRLQDFSAFPAWSPDGAQLAFRSDVSGETSLYGITIGNEDVSLLYAGGSFPNWAP